MVTFIRVCRVWMSRRPMSQKRDVTYSEFYRLFTYLEREIALSMPTVRTRYFSLITFIGPLSCRRERFATTD